MLKDPSGTFFLFTIALRMSNAYALGADQWLKRTSACDYTLPKEIKAC